MEFVNITYDIKEAVHYSGTQEDLCLVNAMHVIAYVFILDLGNRFSMAKLMAGGRKEYLSRLLDNSEDSLKLFSTG